MKIIKPNKSMIANNVFHLVANYTLENMKNGDSFMIIIPKKLLIDDTIQVVIDINENEYILQDILGNYIMTDQLFSLPSSTTDKEFIARVKYGCNPTHFKILITLSDSKILEEMGV